MHGAPVASRPPFAQRCGTPPGNDAYPRTSLDRYLALSHSDVPEIAIRDVSTGAIVVACGSTEPPGYNGDSDYSLMEAAALVSDDFVLVAVNTDDDGDFENHLLLSTRGLRWQADVDYGLDMTQNAIAAPDGQGRWLTRGPGATVRLWQLPDRINCH